MISRRLSRATALGVLLLCALLGVAAVLHHEWWRDEAYTWLVLGEARSLRDLLDRLGFNGHPRLFYVLAYAVHGVLPDPRALGLLNLGLSLGAIALFLFTAPLAPAHRVLFALGFLPLYQYGVIARSYALFLLLLFGHVAARVRAPTFIATRLLLLAVLAQVHLLAMATVGVLLLLELHEQVPQRFPRRLAPLFPTPRRPAPRYETVHWFTAGLVVLSLLDAAWQVVPRGPGHASIGTGFGAFVHALANGFLPDYDRLHDNTAQKVVGLVLFALAPLCLLPARDALRRYVWLATPLIAICAVIYGGHRWHHGFFLIFFLVAVWLDGAPPRPAAAFLTLVLSVQAVVGLWAVVADVRRPYSSGPDAARAAQQAGLSHLPLLGLWVRRDDKGKLIYRWDIDQVQPVLLVLPGAQAYDPVDHSFERYWRHYADPDHFADLDAAQVQSGLRDISARLKGKVLVVLAYHGDLRALDPPPPLQLVRRLPESLDYGERLDLFVLPENAAFATPADGRKMVP